MSLATSTRNIKIHDNSIDLGFSSTGSIAANYTYTSNLTLGGDAIVTNNTFMGSIGNGNAATNLASITAGSSIVTDNRFIRGVGSPVATYINVTSSFDQTIKDNIFDQSTIDGTVETLVTGLSTRSIYYGNKNQIGYIAIPMVAGTFTSDPAATDIVGDASSSVSASFNYLTVFINTLTARVFYINFDMNAALPESVRILGIKVGIFNVVVGGATLTTGSFSIELDVQDIVAANFATGVNSILDSKNRAATLVENISSSIDLAANLAASQAATLYASIDTSLGNNADNFINSKDKAMTLIMLIANDLAVLGGGMDWVISPAVVKFIY